MKSRALPNTKGGEIEIDCNSKFRKTKVIFLTTYSFDNKRETLKVLELLTRMEICLLDCKMFIVMKYLVSLVSQVFS